jgi:hypothetical protein
MGAVRSRGAGAVDSNIGARDLGGSSSNSIQGEYGAHEAVWDEDIGGDVMCYGGEDSRTNVSDMGVEIEQVNTYAVSSNNFSNVMELKLKIMEQEWGYLRGLSRLNTCSVTMFHRNLHPSRFISVHQLSELERLSLIACSCLIQYVQHRTSVRKELPFWFNILVPLPHPDL